MNLRNQQSRQPEPLHHLSTLGCASLRNSPVSNSHPTGPQSCFITLGSPWGCSLSLLLLPRLTRGSGTMLTLGSRALFASLTKETAQPSWLHQSPWRHRADPQQQPSLGQAHSYLPAQLHGLLPQHSLTTGHPLNGYRNLALARPQTMCLACTLPHKEDASPNF